VEFVTTQESVSGGGDFFDFFNIGLHSRCRIGRGVELAGDTIDGSRIMLSRFNAE
jgi:hypothetical protein